MPLVGHLAENGLVLHHDFREGNEVPSDRNLPFLHACLHAMPPGKRVKPFRADAASFQRDLLNALAGKIVRHAGALLLKVPRETFWLLPALRLRIAGGTIP